MQRVRKWMPMDTIIEEVKPHQETATLASVVRASQVQMGEGGDSWRVMPAPKCLCPLKKPYDKLIPVELLVDSGAAESVIPPRELPGHPVHPNAASMSGEEYLTADGKTIPNKGEQAVNFRTQEGHRCALTFQVTDVTKPLLSTTQLADTGHETVFRKTGGTIRHLKTGRELHFTRRAGLYILKIWVEPPAPQGFARQGAAP